MDDVELSQRQSEQFRDLALRAAGSKPPAEESATECVRCGTTIPEKRRKAVPGCRLCIDCMRTAEERR